MAKYDFELKLKIVREYQEGRGGYGYLANKFGICDKWLVKRWIEAYKKFGADRLMRSRKKETYSFDFKLHGKRQI